jgi:hypothetical protein
MGMKSDFESKKSLKLFIYENFVKLDICLKYFVKKMILNHSTTLENQTSTEYGHINYLLLHSDRRNYKNG